MAILMLGPFLHLEADNPRKARVLALNAPTESAIATIGSTDRAIIISRELPMEA